MLHVCRAEACTAWKCAFQAVTWAHGKLWEAWLGDAQLIFSLANANEGFGSVPVSGGFA